MRDYQTHRILIHYWFIAHMPTSKLSTLWLSVSLLNGRRILRSEDSMALYDLPASPLAVGTFGGKEYRPTGLAGPQIANLDPFIERAAAQKPIEELIKFIEGKGDTHTGDSLGRSIFRAWFTKAHMYNKVNDIWDRVLADKQCRPQDLISDNANAIRAGLLEGDFGTGLPSSRGVRAKCDEDLIEALFGEAASGARTVDPNVQYCMGGFWHHEWDRYRKIRKGALDKFEVLKQGYQDKRDGECFHDEYAFQCSCSCHSYSNRPGCPAADQESAQSSHDGDQQIP